MSKYSNSIRWQNSFQPKLARRDKAGHLIIIKGTIPPKGTAILNLKTLNTGVPNFI